MKIFICFSLIAGLCAPAQNFCAPTTLETAANILTAIADGEYLCELDYNGDGILTVSDAINELRRAAYVLTGNEITVTADTINEIVDNEDSPCIYWEFDQIGDTFTRCYEIMTAETITADIYAEYEDDSTKHFTIKINPQTETVSVIE